MATHAGMFVPLDTSGNGMSALDGRLALGGLIGTVQRCIVGGAITGSTSNMQFTVAQSVFELADLDNTGAMMLTAFDATVLPAIPAGPSSGSRIDSIIVRQQIVGNSLGDTATPGLMQTVQGTASTGTPGPPAIPAGWYEYARITVPANASTGSACSVQVLYPATLAPTPIQASSAAALSLITGQTVGQLALVGTAVYRWNGSLWRQWSGSDTGVAYPGTVSASPGVTHWREGRQLSCQFGIRTGANGLASGGAIFQTSNVDFKPAANIDVLMILQNTSNADQGIAHGYWDTGGTLHFQYWVTGTGGAWSSSINGDVRLAGTITALGVD